MKKRPDFFQPPPVSEPTPTEPEAHTVAIEASSNAHLDTDTLVVVIQRKIGAMNGLTMNCAVARNGVLITGLPESVGPGYEVFEVKKLMLIARRIWTRMRAGKDLPWEVK